MLLTKCAQLSHHIAGLCSIEHNLTCKHKPVLFADSLHKTSIAYSEPTFPNHLKKKTKLFNKLL